MVVARFAQRSTCSERSPERPPERQVRPSALSGHLAPVAPRTAGAPGAPGALGPGAPGAGQASNGNLEGEQTQSKGQTGAKGKGTAIQVGKGDLRIVLDYILVLTS